MNKGDVEMEDVGTESRVESESVEVPEDTAPDGAELITPPIPELDASLKNIDDSEMPHEVENGDAQLPVDGAVVEEQKKTELEQGQESSLPPKEEEEGKEAGMVSGDQTMVEINEPEQEDGAKNKASGAAGEEINGSGEAEQEDGDKNEASRATGEEVNGNGEAEQEEGAKNEANGAAEQQDVARIEANGDAQLQNEANSEGPHIAAEAETQAEVDFTSAVQGSSQNGEQIADTLDSMMEDPPSEIALEETIEKPASESTENPASETTENPASEIGVGKIVEKPASKAAEEEVVHSHVGELPFQLPVSEIPPKKKEVLDGPSRSGEIAKGLAQEVNHSETAGLVKMELDNKLVLPSTPVTKPTAAVSPSVNKPSPATPDMSLKYSGRRDAKTALYDDGTPEQQAAFIRELEVFYRQRGVEFKTPKFYGHPLNCYKLWTSVIRLGGYDLVTGTKLWRQVGESFHPPKTCTTISWTFRIFYEKSLLDYERYKVQSGELELPAAPLEPPSADNEGNGHQASGSGRARRDSATRAMQGWHAQRLYDEDKSPITSMQKRENKIKSIGSLKQKRPNEGEPQPFVKTPRTETPKQLVPTIADVGPPADWVKINVRETKDCFEVYALVPGLLREEVRVQSDPAGRLVITGQPEQTENPWGITSFRKVVSLPGRIDPLGTSAVVSLHGRLYVRVPFEQQPTTN